MGKPHPIELWDRVVAMVEEGHCHRAAARHFRVSPKFVNDMVKLKASTRSLDPKRQGNPGRGKLSGHDPWVRQLLGARPGLALDEFRDALAAEQGLQVHRASIDGWLHRLGLSHKRTLLASEIKRPEVAHARHIWRERRQPFMRNLLERLAFIDKTSLKTNLVKTTGWAPVGARLIGHAPFGHLIPTLRPGDVVILDNLSSNKSPKAAAMLKDVGAWFLPLPPNSPDLNPIEMAFAKLKTVRRENDPPDRFLNLLTPKGRRPDL